MITTDEKMRNFDSVAALSEERREERGRRRKLSLFKQACKLEQTMFFFLNV